MGFAILADEHTERQVARSLCLRGHDVEMVVDVLGVGVPDHEIARHARTTDRLLLTSDTDFLSEFPPATHAGVLFQPDDRLSPRRVTTIVSRIDEHLDQDDVEGVVYLTADWL